ncbi:MAG: type II toxin-antitoxin system RelE/ParE family toxin [Psychrosphaera sp.]|nr:type II toxin-antitoxin system RelE/ParE family toxin [Psychrosphaera sp.]
MRIFVTDDFADFMKVAGLSDQDIKKSANEVNNGLFDADLGGVIKKRIAPKGMSKREASRSIIAFRMDDKIFFVDGWRKADVPKKGKEIPDKLLETYRLLGRCLLSASDKQIQIDITQGLLIEIE